MPIPHYIAGSQSRAEDKVSGFVSYFEILESIDVSQFDIADQEVRKELIDAAATFWFTASWMREDIDDPAQEYEGEWVAHSPNDAEPVVFRAYKFTIAKRTHRVSVRTSIVPKRDTTTGIRVVENRIRRAGTADKWLSQRFPFWVESENPQKTTNP